MAFWNLANIGIKTIEQIRENIKYLEFSSLEKMIKEGWIAD